MLLLADTKAFNVVTVVQLRGPLLRHLRKLNIFIVYIFNYNYSYYVRLRFLKVTKSRLYFQPLTSSYLSPPIENASDEIYQ